MVERDETIPQGNEEAPKETAEQNRISGVFSSQTLQKVGTGTTQRKTIQKSFWMANELEDGVIEIQPLNVNYIPSGPKRKIAKEDLLQKFSPEPEFYTHSVYPAIRNLNKQVEDGEAHRAKGELFSAEHKFKRALDVDVDNVRANFGLGLTYLARNEAAKAENIFERLVKLDAAFEPEHKHLFNDFGISLRKNQMYDQALEYYGRAMELAHVDEHLHYNIARAFFEKRLIDKTAQHLQKALEINPELEAASQFLQWLQDKGLLEAFAPEMTAARGDEAAPEGEPPSRQEGRGAAES